MNSLSRISKKWKRLADYGTIPLGAGFTISVSLFQGPSGKFVWIGVTLAGHPMRRGLALWLDEVGSVVAFLGRAAADVPKGQPLAGPM